MYNLQIAIGAARSIFEEDMAFQRLEAVTVQNARFIIASTLLGHPTY